MGATESPEKWEDQYQIIDKSSHNGLIKVRHKVHHDRFDIISIRVMDETDKQQLFMRISKRQTRKSPFIVPLLRAFHHKQEFICSRSEKYDLIFMESAPTVLDLLRFRQSKQQSFSNEEIMHIIKNVAGALKDFGEFKQEYGSVTLNNIVIKGKVMLKDNFLVKEEERDYYQFSNSKKIKGYPSPQKLYDCFDTLTGLEQFPADLFSLGVVALQLYYPLMTIKEIYINKNPQYENNKVNFELINSLVQGIRSVLLKEALTILLNFQPSERLNIYRLCETFPKEVSKLRMFRQNPWSLKKEDELVEPINPYEQNKPPIFKSQITGNATTNYSSITNGSMQKKSTMIFSPQYPAYQPQKSIISNNSSFQRFDENNSKTIKFTHDSATHSPNINGFNKISFHQNQLNYEQPQFRTYNNNFDFKKQLQLPTAINFKNIKSKQIENTYGWKPFQQIKSNMAQQSTRVQLNTFPSFNSGFLNSPLDNNLKLHSMPLKDQTKTNNASILDNYHFTQFPIEDKANDAKLNSFQTINKQPKVLLQESNHLKKLEGLLNINNPVNAIPQTKSQTDKSSESEVPEYVEEEYQIGTKYQGYKKNGKRNGQGKFYYKEGSHYDGEWKDNRMDGEGVLYYPDGNIAYNGQWQNDEFHGKGVIYNDKPVPIPGAFDYTNFSPLEDQWLCYEGQLKHDAKWGVGKLVLTNGEYYEGEFQNDIIHGQGTFTRMNGNKVRGVWNSSCLKKIIV